MKVSITELNKCPDKYISQAIKEPVFIEKYDQPMVVIVSHEHYTMLEDTYWKKLALMADKEKSIGINKSKKILQDGN